MRSGTSLTFTLLTLTSCFVEAPDEHLSSLSQGARVRGAIFTTLVDGSAVNHNLYAAKTDVYLDGGPSGGGPSGAAALDAGDYYFQVTDPSGQVLLSTDAIECRRVHVSNDGVIDAVIGGCAHATGIDQDYAALGAITVQLMPYANTPNPGGVYKVWVTPVGAYVGGGYSAGVSYGFVPSFSKTDVFKVNEVVVTPPEPPDDNGDCDHGCPVCGDGHVDSGEQCDDGNTTNGDGCSSTCTTELPPPPDTTCCGNGTIDPGEQCDDDNLIDGDGCSSVCTLEPPDEDCGSEGCDGGGEYPQPDPDDGSLCHDCVSTVQTSAETIFVP
jgi:cysteine-rich repeat protein